MSKNTSKFDREKFVFLNQQFIQKEFRYHNEIEQRESTIKFRDLLLEQCPDLDEEIRKVTYPNLAKIMEILIPRIEFYKDLLKHRYFYRKPDFEETRALSLKKKILKDPQAALSILQVLVERFEQLPEKFSSEEFNMICSKYLYEQF